MFQWNTDYLAALAAGMTHEQRSKLERSVNITSMKAVSIKRKI
jgi:hypothetical protein